MYLIDYEYDRRNDSEMLSHKEDPFTIMANETFSKILKRNVFKKEDSKIGIAFSNCFGGWTFGEHQLLRLKEEGPRRISPFQSTAWFPAAAQGQVTIKNQIKCPAITFGAEFFAFYDALFMAKYWLQSGICEVVFVGASESIGSSFLSNSIGSKPTHNVSVWFAVGNIGKHKIQLLKKENLYLEPFHIKEENYKGTPINGSCALPLMIIDVLLNSPGTLSLNGKIMIKSNREEINIYRNSHA